MVGAGVIDMHDFENYSNFDDLYHKFTDANSIALGRLISMGNNSLHLVKNHFDVVRENIFHPEIIIRSSGNFIRQNFGNLSNSIADLVNVYSDYAEESAAVFCNHHI